MGYDPNLSGRTEVRYLDAGDLFVNRLIETGEGTCGSLAALYLGMVWRFGWPVSLACTHDHFIARYDDGSKTYNVNVSPSESGFGVFDDARYIRDY